MPRDYWQLSAIEGDPMDNLDSAFAKLGIDDSPLLDFATPNQVLTPLALHGREKARDRDGAAAKKTCRMVKRNE